MFGMWDAIYARLLKGSVKSVQRGTTASSGNITINAVNPAKTIVLSKSKGSAGTVAATGSSTFTLSANAGGTTLYFAVTSDSNQSIRSSGGYQSEGGYYGFYRGTINLGGGTTNLTTKEYSAQLVNNTTISCDGPVEWQVIEFV